MNSRYWRTVTRNLVLNIAIEYAICLCLAYYFTEYDRPLNALMIMLALWAIQIALWAKKLAVTVVQYYLLGKRQMVGEIEAAFRKYSFPIYDQFVPDAVEYLSFVLRDETADVDQITFAASALGQIELLKQMQPTGAWRMMSAIENALDAYRTNPSGRRVRHA